MTRFLHRKFSLFKTRKSERIKSCVPVFSAFPGGWCHRNHEWKFPCRQKPSGWSLQCNSLATLGSCRETEHWLSLGLLGGRRGGRDHGHHPGKILAITAMPLAITAIPWSLTFLLRFLKSVHYTNVHWIKVTLKSPKESIWKVLLRVVLPWDHSLDCSCMQNTHVTLRTHGQTHVIYMLGWWNIHVLLTP